MRPFNTLLAAVVLVGMAGTPLLAQRGGGGHAGGMGGGMNSGMGAGHSGSNGQPGMNPTGHPSGTDHNMASGSMDHGKTPSELLAQNTQLASKVGSVLPAGADVQQAAVGFKNLGEFVAAAHVSKNLGIPFDDLKAKITGNESMSLGKAIHTLKPEVDSKAEAKRAKKSAEADLKEVKG
jgi:hypothetical protein